MIRVLYLAPKPIDAARATDVLLRAGVGVACPASLEELLSILSNPTAQDDSFVVLFELDRPEFPAARLIETVRLCFSQVPIIAALRGAETVAVAEASQKGAAGFVMIGEQWWHLLPEAIRTIVSAHNRFQEIQHSASNNQQHTRLLNELKASYAHSRALSQQLVRLKEEESARIARELHDELGQALTGLKLDVAWLERRLNRLPSGTVVSEIRTRLENMQKSIDATIATTRKICSELRPGILDDLGLAAAIDWQINEFKKRSNIKVQLSLPTKQLQIEPAVATAVFRIFQELLTNIARHSNARSAIVKLQEANGELVLEVSDDGRGFDESALSGTRTLGLLGMKERAHACGGVLNIQSAPGHGTVASLRVPMAVPPCKQPPPVSGPSR